MRNWLIAAAAALVALAGAGCGSAEGGPTEVSVHVAGVDFTLPADTAASPVDASGATITAMLSQSGYLPRATRCYSESIAEAPEAQLAEIATLPPEQRPAAAFAIASRQGRACVKRNEPLIEATATPEQLARFRELSSVQFGQFLAGQGANARQSACVLGFYRKMSDERLVRWTNGPAPQQRSSLLNWAGRCQRVVEVIGPSG
jgi:hypothetical protein